jgi:glutaredoxin-related protein
MARPVLEEDKIHPALREQVSAYSSDIIEEVQRAVADSDVVVVGMKQNPYPRRARKMLQEKGVDFRYLEYGSYLKDWRRRLALKMWTGFGTFPMIFVKGVLIGGASDLRALIDSGELDAMLSTASE